MLPTAPSQPRRLVSWTGAQASRLIDRPQPLTCSIGIMGYNEEANIGPLLESILSQRTAVAAITEIIVIASGCTDGTEAIVKSFAMRDPRIRLLVQARREGKASAINYFLSEAKEKILLVSSADIIACP